jgi:RNA polymerase sigma factor (sigma-70 family)
MEHNYIRQVLDGDVSQYSHVIDQYKNMAYSIAFRILNNNEDAEEAVQDSFLRAYNALHSFKGESKFSTWLYKIVVNTSINKSKGRRQFVNDINIDDLSEDHLAADVEPVLKKLVQQDRIKFVNLALDKLMMEDRLLLTLYYLNENSIAEISAITSISGENIKMKIHRARKKMFVILNGELKNER